MEGLYDLYPLPNILREIKSVACGTDEGRGRCIKDFSGET